MAATLQVPVIRSRLNVSAGKPFEETESRTGCHQVTSVASVGQTAVTASKGIFVRRRKPFRAGHVGDQGAAVTGRRRPRLLRAGVDGEQVWSHLERATEKAEEKLRWSVNSVRSAADSEGNGTPARSEEIFKSAAQQLREQAENLKASASLAREQLLETAGKTREELAIQAGLTAEQLKVQTDKTAAQLKEEAEKATEELKIQAERAAAQIAVTAHETAEKAKEELVRMKEIAPESIKEIAETAIEAHSVERAKSGAIIHDFCLGIPYGGLLVVGGLFWFLLTGSLHALRFGVMLGGMLLAVSVHSLHEWQQRKPTNLYIAIQGGISLILAAKEASRFLVNGAIFPTLVTAVASAAMVAFYAYVILAGGPPMKKSNLDGATS